MVLKMTPWKNENKTIKCLATLVGSKIIDEIPDCLAIVADKVHAQKANLTNYWNWHSSMLKH